MLVVGAAAAILALPASASAAKEVFAGTTDNGARIAMDVKFNGKLFSFERTDTYGNESAFEGKLKGKRLKKAAGIFTYGQHYPATEQYPEENCTTGAHSFSMKRGAKDVVPPAKR